eukprot:GFYU01009145.1.p1 GENE.GFYU01009145.1~~GFYU01009145.1.p1  ORF type:complete len:249 (-),score=53.82 GFYU01009145.1:230-976(-)
MEIRPVHLEFELWKNAACTRHLEILNTGSKSLGFKVKTTAPRRYCVRPNQGLVEAGAKLQVSIVLQAFKELPEDIKCKDKFLVQGFFVDNDADASDPATLQKATLMDQKLKCTWVLGDGAKGVADKDAATLPPKSGFKPTSTPSSATNGSDSSELLNQLTALKQSRNELQDQLTASRAELDALKDANKALTASQNRLKEELKKAESVQTKTANAGGGGINLVLTLIIMLLAFFAGMFKDEMLLLTTST